MRGGERALQRGRGGAGAATGGGNAGTGAACGGALGCATGAAAGRAAATWCVGARRGNATTGSPRQSFQASVASGGTGGFPWKTTSNTREVYELAGARARNRGAHLIELHAKQALARLLVHAARDGEDVLAVREREALVRIVLALEDDLGRRDEDAVELGGRGGRVRGATWVGATCEGGTYEGGGAGEGGACIASVRIVMSAPFAGATAMIAVGR